MKKFLLHHHRWYLLEVVFLLFGFFLVYLFSYDVSLQFMLLVFILLSYITTGFIHHFIHHDLKAKVVLEYVLISLLILSAFVLLNSSRL